MSEVITCPSGFSGEVRGLTGAEARLLSDRAAIKSGVFLDKILQTCWLETVDPGPYKFEGKPDWSQVLVGDRFFVMLKIRSRSFGPTFDFKLQCTSPSCRERFDHQIALDDLPVKTLSEEDRAAFASGNRLEGRLPDGRAFWFRLPTGADEARFARMGVGSVTSILGPILSRIHEVEGMNDVEKRKHFEQSELGLTYAALAEMEAHDCGVETQIYAECPSCFQGMDIEIPFAQGFLAPAGNKKKS